MYKRAMLIAIIVLALVSTFASADAVSAEYAYCDFPDIQGEIRESFPVEDNWGLSTGAFYDVSIEQNCSAGVTFVEAWQLTNEDERQRLVYYTWQRSVGWFSISEGVEGVNVPTIVETVATVVGDSAIFYHVNVVPTTSYVRVEVGQNGSTSTSIVSSVPEEIETALSVPDICGLPNRLRIIEYANQINPIPLDVEQITRWGRTNTWQVYGDCSYAHTTVYVSGPDEIYLYGDTFYAWNIDGEWVLSNQSYNDGDDWEHRALSSGTRGDNVVIRTWFHDGTVIEAEMDMHGEIEFTEDYIWPSAIRLILVHDGNPEYADYPPIYRTVYDLGVYPDSADVDNASREGELIIEGDTWYCLNESCDYAMLTLYAELNGDSHAYQAFAWLEDESWRVSHTVLASTEGYANRQITLVSVSLDSFQVSTCYYEGTTNLFSIDKSTWQVDLIQSNTQEICE